MIYGRADTEVTPPAHLRPELAVTLNATRPGIRLDLLNIAIVVSSDGKVESARGLTDPQNLAEFILLTDALTVVKAWEFAPATKNGVAVRYREVVPVRDLVRPAAQP